MTISKLGPKEIFNPSDKEPQFHKEDSPGAVEEFKYFYKGGGTNEFKNGDLTNKNILLLAAREANVHLVKYIVENGEPIILDMRDHCGYTALFHLGFAGKTTEKVIECARILIEAGANINAREICVHGPGDNLLGRCLSSLVKYEKWHRKQIIEIKEKLIELLIEYGATQVYTDASNADFDDRKIRHFSIGDDIINGSIQAATCSRILRSALGRVVEKKWIKARLLLLGSNDPNSTLSGIPQDIKTLLLNKTILES